MNIQESDSTVSYYSHADVVKTALVWIDTETNKLYIRTTEGFSPLDRLNGLVRSADGNPVFTKLPVAPEPAPRPKSLAEAQELQRRQAIEALTARNRQRNQQQDDAAQLSPRLQQMSDAARRIRNQSASARTNPDRVKPVS